VVDDAIGQLPAAWRAGHHPGDPTSAIVHPVLVRADTAGAVREFIDGLIARNCEFSVGGHVGHVGRCDRCGPARRVGPARDTDGQVRRGAQVAELDVTLDTWPPGTRAICRREKPLSQPVDHAQGSDDPPGRLPHAGHLPAEHLGEFLLTRGIRASRAGFPGNL
jgi:hypothetical protein